MKKLLIILLSTFLMFPAISSDAKPGKPKTVHVKSYKTKKGKTVKEHKRSKPLKKKK